MLFPEIEKLSHATIITGNRSGNLAMVKKYINDSGFETIEGVDFSVIENENLGVDDARAISVVTSLKKIENKRFIIISFDRMTSEAQNALLKSIEEPQVDTHFFILVPNADRLLPTILSRCQILAGEQGAGDTRMDISVFLKTDLAGRFAMVEDWTKNKKDEDNLSKTEVINFLDQIEKMLWGKGNRDEKLFADIRQMRQYANIRGASHRVILDFIAMVVPVLK